MFQGIKFFEYKGRSAGYFRNRKSQLLHRAIWAATYGEIPGGYTIHHIDGNHRNNDITNLECMSRSEHGKHHARVESAKKHLESIRPLASLWHKSPEGRRVASVLFKEAWKKRTPQTYTCKRCAKEYQSLKRSNGPTFCSGACRTADRVASGKDDIDATCVECGKAFRKNRYVKAITCSRSCGARRRSGSRASV